MGTSLELQPSWSNIFSNFELPEFGGAAIYLIYLEVLNGWKLKNMTRPIEPFELSC